jgi:hypothetical protein
MPGYLSFHRCVTVTIIVTSKGSNDSHDEKATNVVVAQKTRAYPTKVLLSALPR